ncbi:si:ch211-191a24.3 isoform X2 [Engraulis encrasicolus]|uniref:si:ch211-191a24.3 isoform X2 n=1 Tax=Engraulis encrasicolus TaxID=184585 RepID=UPI002FD198C0
MEEEQPPVELTPTTTATTLVLDLTDTETVEGQHVLVVDKEDSASTVSERSEAICLDQSERDREEMDSFRDQSEETDSFRGGESPASKEQGLEDRECVISSSEGVSSLMDSPTASSSLVTGSIDSLQSGSLEVQGEEHSSSPETPPPHQSAEEEEEEDEGRCSPKTQVITHHMENTTAATSGESPKHTHTHAWVQRQISLSFVSPDDDSTNHKEGESHSTNHKEGESQKQETEKGQQGEEQREEEEEVEFDVLAKDFDQSLDQLNQLILDLDPEFEPNPAPPTSRRAGHMTRSASLFTNGVNRNPSSGLLYRQASDVTDYPGFHSPTEDLRHVFNHSPLYSPSFTQLYRSESLDYGDQSPVMGSPRWAGSGDQAPPTPAFPVCPPTPYESRGFLNMHSSLTNTHAHPHPHPLTHSASTCDETGPGSLSPASHQRMIGSLRSVSSSSPLPHNHSPSPLRGWDEVSDPASFLTTPLTSHPSHTFSSSSSSSILSPGSHPFSSPSPIPGPGSSSPLSPQSLSGVEPSLLEAVQGFEGLGLEDPSPPPILPQKRRGPDGVETGLGALLNGSSCSSSPELLGSRQDSVKFVQDTTKFWYKPDITREQAIAALKDREPGSFIVRDSHSFRGAYGLAMKVATPPPSVLQQSRKAGDLSSELVRHFLIECTQKGVRLKGCPNEPYFGSLTALVCQHSITPLALPCKLIIPDCDLLDGVCEAPTETATNSAAELLKQGAACNVWFLGSVDLESLTGGQGVQKATSVTLAMSPPPTSTIVHFKVSAQGITLTDNQRKLFFRRHYPVNTVIFCALDPQERRWKKDGCPDAKVFGFVARKSSTSMENVCHLFAEHDPEQPASAIVNFVSKVMIGSHKTK